SPLGAVRMRRGPSSPSAKSSTSNPSGAFGFAPAGRGVSFGGLLADRLSLGAGRSAIPILWRSPGRSWRQSPKIEPAAGFLSAGAASEAPDAPGQRRATAKNLRAALPMGAPVPER